MLDCIYFRAWVANAIHEVSGIWAFDWRGSQRKHALTFEEVRMAACQEGLMRKFRGMEPATARIARLGATHITPSGEILH